MGWLGGRVVRASDSRSRGRGFDPRPRRYQATTLGKLFTPTCLNADSLRYYMVSLKPGTFTFLPLPIYGKNIFIVEKFFVTGVRQLS